MEKLTEEQAFVVTCWSNGILFMDYSKFWGMANECLKRPVLNIEFASEELWEELKEKTKDDFYKLCGAVN